MKKIVKLTEYDLVKIVKKVINEEKLLKESVNISGIKIDATSGGLSTQVSNIVHNYKITVNCGKDVPLVGFTSIYKGPIALSKLWTGKDGGIAGEDNTGKTFSIPIGKAKNLANSMKNGESSIDAEGEGKIAGISGKCYVKLNKKNK
jgi:hypothetical protein